MKNAITNGFLQFETVQKSVEGGSLGQLAGGMASIAQLQNKQSNEAQRIFAI